MDVPTAKDKPSERDDRAVTENAEAERVGVASEEGGASEDHGIRNELSFERLLGSQKSTIPASPPSNPSVPKAKSW